nr:PREDICTED: ras-related protein RABD2b-like [Latimeria chalumnae]|eukprot:XP_014351131.1 PREDICTED: ras-related protein RABD2b-like [Latimeria chalumnae]
MDLSHTYQHQLKVILVGDFGVGKTTLFYRVKTDQYIDVSQSTVFIDTCVKEYCINQKGVPRLVQMTLWDTVGEERFVSLSSSYYRNTDAALLLFSVDKPGTFDNLARWVDTVQYFSNTAQLFVLGNKSDLESQISEEKLKTFADEHNVTAVFKLSAKTGENIESSFLEMVTHFSLKQYRPYSGPIVPLQDKKQTDRCGCLF